MSEIKLLPCPFCGGEARLMSVVDDGEGCINYEDELDMNHSFVHCYNCDMDFIPHTETAREVLEEWNTRKPMERIASRIQQVVWDSCSGDEYRYVSKEIEKIFNEVCVEEGGIE